MEMSKSSHYENPIHGTSAAANRRNPPPPSAPPNRRPNPFMKWKTHQLQEYLLASGADHSIVLHMHVKRDLAIAALQLCNQTQHGIIPSGPPPVKTITHTHTDTKYQKRSKQSYHNARQGHNKLQSKMNRFNAGGYLQKHGKTSGHGPSSGYSLNPGPPRNQLRNNNNNTAQQPGRAPSRTQTHEIMNAAGMKKENSSSATDSHAKYNKPSKLEAMAFAVEHSPRDWTRFERENDEMETIENMKSKLYGTNGRPPPTGAAKSRLERELKKYTEKSVRTRYTGPDMDEHDLEHLKKLDKNKFNSKFSHAYEVAVYSCCSTPLGRHCPHFMCTCKPNQCVGKYGCQMDLCELCCDPCSEKSSSNFSHYGVGLSLYFKFLKWLGFTSLMMFIVVLPEVIINTWGVNKGALVDGSLSVLSLGNLGEVNGTIMVPCWGPYVQTGVQQCPMSRKDIAWLYSILDCAAIGLFFVSYLWLRKSEKEESAHFNDLAGISSVSDYTLLVRSFPPDIHIKGSDPADIVKEERHAEAWLLQFFEDQVRNECQKMHDGKCDDATMIDSQLMDESKQVIHRVIVASDQGKAIQFQKSMAPKRRQVDAINWRIRELKADRALAKAEMDDRNCIYIDRQIEKQIKKQQRIRLWMSKKQKEYRKKQISYRRVPKMVAAFVTFSTDLGRKVILHRYGNGSHCHRYCCQVPSKRYHGTAKIDSKERKNMRRVNIGLAPEPSTMLWQNLGYTFFQKKWRKGLSFLVSLTLVGLAAFIVYYAKTSDPSALGKECLNTTSGAPEDSVTMFGKEISCDGWIREVAQTSEYGDLSVACAPYSEKITQKNIHLTSSNSLARTCGCRSVAFEALKYQNTKVTDLCAPYIQFVAIQNVLQFVAISSVIVVNILYVVAAKKLGVCERHSSLDGQESSVAFAVLLGSFLNTGLVMLLVNAKVAEGSVFSSITNTASGAVDVSAVLQGKYSDFTANWYADVGVAITITMIIYVFSPHIAPLGRYCRFNCKTRSGSTQAILNSKYVGPDFHHSIRYPQISVVIFVSMAYSTGIPILYLIIAATAFTFYWVDKYLFTRWYRTPPQYDAQISLQFSSYLPYAAILHLMFGIWMIANRRMLSSDNSYDSNQQNVVGYNNTSNSSESASSGGDGDGGSSESSFHQSLLAYVGESNGKKNDIISCLSQQHVGPMLVALGAWIVYIILNELWLIVGPLLRKVARCLTCGLCGSHPTVMLNDDFVNEEEHMKQYGLSSYNIFDNPIYQSMFNISQEYANAHVHVESLVLTEIKSPEMKKMEPKKVHKKQVFDTIDTSEEDDSEDED